MSCQLSIFAHFQDIATVREYLFPSFKEETPQKGGNNGSDVWTEDWGWNEDEQMEEDDSESGESTGDERKHNWLQDCLTSISPANDLMAVAYGDKLVLLSQKWDPGDTDVETKFSIKFKESVKQDEGEIITAVLCLPLASQKRSTQGAPDWTCTIVGFSSGYIRIYTETGTLLLSQLLHTEPVQKFKCKTYEPPRYLGLAEQHEELVILFRKALVTVDGFSLYQSLRACRNQVARATAGDTSIHPPPLAYKKWGLQGQEKIQDCCTCGVDTPNPFDQMKSAAMMGPNIPVRPAPATSAKYVTSGVSHYVGVYSAVEGSTQPILSEVAFAVASKLKSALMSAASGWLGFGQKKEEDKVKPKIEPVTPLNMSFGIPDKPRQGDSIHLSPNNNYAATTDNFGRVILIDIDKGTAIRMWKGYRDAQLGWVQVKEDSHHGESPQHRRVAQFLIIYAPRRGILEVWTAGNGPRIAAFNVGKSCQLICPGYGYLGLNNVTSRGVKTKSFQCALLDPSGTIKTLEVPFHLALSDKNSKRARDLHLLKQLKLALKDNTEESETLESTLKSLILDMKISSIAQQGLERVLSTKYLSVDVMRRILKQCLQQFTDKESLDIDSKMFVRHSELKDGLLQTYQMLLESHNKKMDQLDVDSGEEILEKSLNLTNSEATHIVSQLDQYFASKNVNGSGEKSAKRVKFDDDREGMSAASFLSCFHCQTHLLDQDTAHHGSYELLNNLSEEKRTELVKFLFEMSLRSSEAANDLGNILQDSSLSPKLLMGLLVNYWLSCDESSVTNVPSLYHIIKVITQLTDKSIVLADFDNISPWWQKIRDMCCHSNNVLAAYLLSIACRSVAKEVECNEVKAKDPDADTSTIDEPSHCNSVDLQRWDQLVKQLEDVLSLCSLFGLQRSDDISQPIPVSVTKLMEGGRGSISELVAKYIAKTGLHPSDIVRFGYLSDSSMEVDLGVEVKYNVTTFDKIQGYLEVLQHRFVHSLDNDVLYANTSWENAVYWYNDPELVQNLKVSTDYMKIVQNAVLRHGVGAMMWSMFIAKRFQSAALLMEKVAKVPKDRLTRKEIGISEVKMVDFLEAVTDFLDILMESNCEANEVPVFNIEPLWQGIRGPASLVELAVEQKSTNYGLIRHHYHLSLVMQAVLTFNMKSIKVISLFDSKGKNSFFKAFDEHPLLPSQNVDPLIINNRKQFLTKVITCYVHTSDKEDTAISAPFPGAGPVKCKPVVNWCKLVLELAKDFGLDLDFFKRHHVVELYSCGHDKEAEEFLGAVNDRESMGAELLPVAGCRAAYQVLIKNKAWGAELLTNVSPTLTSWLRELKPEKLYQPDVDIQDTANLLQHIANCLPEGFNDYDIAISLVDLVQSMKG